ncbi:MAG: ribosome maturation factor RimM [Xanthomonadales bacterium]|nr:ribosome maturation factor RimM [Xanthomonadales bacterium]|tara:strand:- start:1352 stop:1882 length:531 start_codon:yes stop_codon:yes gene_type:complete
MAGQGIETPVVLGQVHGLFGVKGWIKVYSYTRPVEAILDYDRWWIGRADEARPFQVLAGRMQGKTLIAQLGDENGQPLPDRDAAVALLDRDISVERDELPDLEAGEYYWVDLFGLSVVNTQGVALGTVTAMMETGANDVLVVSGERERLIPLVVDVVVVDVDFGAGQITVDWDADF